MEQFETVESKRTKQVDQEPEERISSIKRPNTESKISFYEAKVSIELLPVLLTPSQTSGSDVLFNTLKGEHKKEVQVGDKKDSFGKRVTTLKERKSGRKRVKNVLGNREVEVKVSFTVCRFFIY